MDSHDCSMIRRLGKYEISMAIDVFAEAIPRHWPNTVAEARKWVHREFRHPDAVVIGHFDGNLLDAVVCLVPFQVVLLRLPAREQDVIKDALSKVSSAVDIQHVVHVGGLAVSEEAAHKGLGARLFNLAGCEAQERRYTLQVGHIARQSRKYPSLHVLTSIVKRQRWRELPVAEKVFYPKPADLEKVWCFKTC